MPQIDELLRYLKDQGGSDLHLAAGLEPRIRNKGRLIAAEGRSVLDNDGVRELIREICGPEQWASYEACGDLDFAYGLDGVARFRANYFRQARGAGAVFRIIPEEIIPLEDLSLPDAVAGLVELEKGLVLVTGPTGSEKSTTLAAMIDRINRSASRHVVTLEDRSSSCTRTSAACSRTARSEPTPRASPTACAPPSARTRT